MLGFWALKYYDTSDTMIEYSEKTNETLVNVIDDITLLKSQVSNHDARLSMIQGIR